MDLPQKYKEYLEKKCNLNPISIKNYLSDFRVFIRWLSLKSKGLPTPLDEIIASLKPSDIVEYQNYLLSKKLAKSTINRRLSGLKIFCQFMLERNYVSRNLSIHIKAAPLSSPIEKQVHDYVSKFGLYLKKKTASKSTIKNYTSDIRQYLLWASSQLGQDKDNHPDD
jgi:site-specific recombinase XerD